MILSRSPRGGQPAHVIPINAPSRDELLGRIALAQSVLAHRPSTPANWAILSRILNGASIDDLIHPAGGAA